MAFMQPQIYAGTYFQVNTSHGTEIVPTYLVGRTMDVHVDALLDYLSGTPDDAEETCEVREGWLARLSAPGYMDCTEWTAHTTEEEASAYLADMYGGEDFDC